MENIELPDIKIDLPDLPEERKFYEKPKFYLLVGATILCILFCVIKCCCSKKDDEDDEASSSEPKYLQLDDDNNNPKTDVQNKLKDCVKWICSACGFQNLNSKSECVLCETKKGAEVTNLNSTQERALERKEWVRQIDEHGNLTWTRPCNDDSARKSEGYVAVPEKYHSGNPNDTRLTFVAVESNRKFQTLINYDVKMVQRMSQVEFYAKYAWFLKQTALLFSPFSEGHVELKVSREVVFKDTFRLLRSIEGENLHQIWRVTFKDEEVNHADAVQRDWYSLVAQRILDPANGLFLPNEENYYHINPNSEFAVGEGRNHLEDFECFGKFLGRAILDGQVLPFRFCIPFMKNLLNVPLSFSDLQALDNTLYQSLTYIANEESEVEVANLELYFNVSTSNDEVIELKPGGQHILVTQSNKKEYLHLMWKHIMLDRFGPQLQSILNGLHQVIALDLLMVFDYKELELLICGVSSIDLVDWEANTIVCGDGNNMVVAWFWEIMAMLTEGEKAKLLQFATGSPRLPVQGFEGLTSCDGRNRPFSLQLTIHCDSNQFIKSHMCFNQLDIPMFDSKMELKEAVDQILKIEHYDFNME